MDDASASSLLSQLSFVFGQFAFVHVVGTAALFILDPSGCRSGGRLMVSACMPCTVTGVAVLVITLSPVTVVGIAPSLPLPAPMRHGSTPMGSNPIPASHGVEIVHVQALLTDRTGRHGCL